jgi:hypothetical protein
MVDVWIEKALRMQRETECFSTITILKAALWLEKKHREVPYYDTAAILSLHYLVLALRKKENGPALLRDHCISETLMWKREAINLLAQATSATL